MSEEIRGRMGYLDLLITTLMEHEKDLDEQIDRLERIVKELKELSEKQKKRDITTLKYYGQVKEVEP